MSPFHQFGLWARRAPAGERAVAALGAALALGLAVWLVVPESNRATTSAATLGASQPVAGATSAAAPTLASTAAPLAGGPASLSSASGAPGAATVAAGPVPTGASGPTSVPPGPVSRAPVGHRPGAATTSAAHQCVTPPGTDQGVNGAQIKLGIILVYAGSNAAASGVGVATVQEQQDAFQTVIDAINASGGVGCRYKLVAQYFQGDALDPTNLQQNCINVQQAGVFAVIDYGAYFEYPALAQCYPNNHIPYFGIAIASESEQQQNYPYFFSISSTAEAIYRNTVYALHDRGFFGAANGFSKLGFLYRTCIPEEPGKIIAWLNAVGVPSSQIVTYSLSCPTGFANPGDLAAAVLRFQQAHVTHVTQAEAAVDWANFTTIAERNGFRPKYGLPDDALVALADSKQPPDANNMANAISITGSRFGEQHTPGAPVSSGTVRCNAIFAARGKPSVYQQTLAVGGSACDDLWYVAAAIDHAPALRRDALAAGLQTAHSVELSYPYGPNVFGPRVTTGSQFWRPVQFFTDCACFRLLDTTFHQPYS
jgi:hypothetical protein